jgi:hypothetical protein
MASYTFAHRGAAVPYDAPFQTVLKRHIDMPNLIANPGKLALAASPTVPLTTFTGFGSADVLELWEVPAGFCVTHVGVRVTTVEGAQLTADIGNASATQTHLLGANADGLMGTLNLNSAVTQIGLIADEDLGGSTYNQLVFVTDGSIDITFNDAGVGTFVADLWVNGYKAW